MTNNLNAKQFHVEKNKRYLVIVTIVLFLIGTILLVSGAYAYYRSTITGEVIGTVAVWQFDANNTSASSFNIVLTPDANSTSTESSTIAPDTSGSFTLSLSTADSDLAADYIITFSNFSNVPANLTFYNDSAFTQVTNIAGNGYSISGTLDAHDNFSKTIYWKWPYGDETSVNADNASKNTAVSFTANIVGTQHNS